MNVIRKKDLEYYKYKELECQEGDLNPRYLDLQSSAFPGFAGPRYRATTTPPWRIRDNLNLVLKNNFKPN